LTDRARGEGILARFAELSGQIARAARQPFAMNRIRMPPEKASMTRTERHDVQDLATSPPRSVERPDRSLT
jgi:hypothetical protein